MKTKDASRLLSLVLRHQPEKLNLKLDPNGWVSVAILLTKIDITSEQLTEIVVTSDKQRFAFNEDKTMIRANQGHSVQVDLQLKRVEPTSVLFHGTANRHVASIMTTGLNSGTRHHVHMSDNHGTAVQVGMRSGSAVLLAIDAPAMVSDNVPIYMSENGVYLTEYVDPKYISVFKN